MPFTLLALLLHAPTIEQRAQPQRAGAALTGS
jgi:hypothetical protein